MIESDVVNGSRVVLLVGGLSDLKYGDVMSGHGGYGDRHVLGLYLERKQQSHWYVLILSTHCSIGLPTEWWS